MLCIMIDLSNSYLSFFLPLFDSYKVNERWHMLCIMIELSNAEIFFSFPFDSQEVNER